MATNYQGFQFNSPQPTSQPQQNLGMFQITCCIDGTIYDTFYPGDRLVWEVYKVK